jgi:multiple sugar transport system substrate-binding protein
MSKPAISPISATFPRFLRGMMTLGMPLAALAAGPATFGVDDGTHITLWSRAATQARADALVKAYNATHKNHIDATYVPTDDYQTKVGAAAAAGGLPDLFSADVVFMPNWTSAGLFTDLTDKIATLPFAANIAQGAINASTWKGKRYGLPFVVDLSVWNYLSIWKNALFGPAVVFTIEYTLIVTVLLGTDP